MNWAFLSSTEKKSSVDKFNAIQGHSENIALLRHSRTALKTLLGIKKVLSTNLQSAEHKSGL